MLNFSRKKHIILIVLLSIFSIGFIRTTLRIVGSSKRLDEIKEEVAGLEKKRDDLKNEITYKQTQSYVEEQARNSLNLVKPGEKIYVVEGEGIEDFSSKRGLGYGEDVLGVERQVTGFKATNIYAWYKLFF